MSRMGSDKALLTLDGRPMWERQLDLLRALQPQELFLSGPPFEAARGWPFVADVCPDAGPLAGLGASLRHSASPALVVLAVDMPGMTADFLRALDPAI